MKIELNNDQLTSLARETIKALEAEVRSLKNKLASRDRTIAAHNRGMDLTKERRDKIHDLVDQLSNELVNAKWTDFDNEEY